MVGFAIAEPTLLLTIFDLCITMRVALGAIHAKISAAETFA